MNISPQALEVMKHHEGVRFKPYRCPAYLWTIGVGHLMYPSQARLPMIDRMSVQLTPQDNKIFTKEEVNAILRKDLSNFERGVTNFCGVLNQNRFDALVSFSFNLGLGTLQRSTLRQKVLRGDHEGAAQEFLKYCKAGGKILPGLLKRRQYESSLYLSTN